MYSSLQCPCIRALQWALTVIEEPGLFTGCGFTVGPGLSNYTLLTNDGVEDLKR